MANKLKPCIVIPVYNHEHAIGIIVERLLSYKLPVILVDDGSEPSCATVLREISDNHEEVDLIVLPENLGKGGAVKTGLRHALKQGHSHALQIDADGQHNTDDVAQFLKQSEQNPKAIICGYPIYDDSVPKVRYYARYLTHVWVWINSLSLRIKDSMCGFRIYPLEASVDLINSEYVGNRMDYDSEIMVRWVWRNGEVINVGTEVSYPIDGVSHFKLWQDNVFISGMHTRLFFGMLIRLPKLLYYKLSQR